MDIQSCPYLNIARIQRWQNSNKKTSTLAVSRGCMAKDMGSTLIITASTPVVLKKMIFLGSSLTSVRYFFMGIEREANSGQIPIQGK